MNNSDVDALNLKLLANFIHQVVNPLNGVSGILRNVVDGRITDENRVKQRLNQSSVQLGQCISLIKNLAYFAQGFQPIDDSEKTNIVVPKLIIDSINFFQEQASNKGVDLELLNPQDQFRYDGHLELCKQVVINLIDNAVKYCDPGTKINIYSDLVNNSNYLRITVESSGKRIMPDDVNRIFEVGHRGKNGKDILASGTGLGLYICKEIVETCHGGKIWCESTSAGLTKFFVKFPI
ncbi:MAG: HAMP domain-containing histidine kinase [Rhodospirillales bacterium]|nr:HAMP domain-containing histidine kinase [Rhodospirillales bacterium]